MIESAVFRAHRYRSSCGRLDLYARVYESDGPALLLMHGLTRNSSDFESLAAHLAGRYRLVVPDVRGRGLSDYDSDPSQYRPDVYSGDMFTLLDGLGIEQAGLIGTSMGGLMAMVMAATQPARVPAMVLNDVGPQVEPAGIARIQSYVGPSGDAADWEDAAVRCAAINGTAFPDYDKADWLAFARRTWRESDGRLRLAYDPAIATGLTGGEQTAVPPDLWPLWHMLRATPTLVLRGAESDLLSAKTVDEMRRRHVGVFVSVEVQGRGHAPMLDEDDTTTAIDAFLLENLS